jgi:hypothetical protein
MTVSLAGRLVRMETFEMREAGGGGLRESPMGSVPKLTLSSLL